jgi:hypothetical protein
VRELLAKLLDLLRFLLTATAVLFFKLSSASGRAAALIRGPVDFNIDSFVRALPVAELTPEQEARVRDASLVYETLRVLETARVVLVTLPAGWMVSVSMKDATLAPRVGPLADLDRFTRPDIAPRDGVSVAALPLEAAP